MPPSACRAPPGMRRKSPVDTIELKLKAQLRAATALLLSDLDDAVLGAGHAALDHEQVVLGVDRVDGETDLRPPLAAHPARHLHALEDARGRRGGADRARLADVVRAVARRAAAEVVALDRAGEALADR